MRVEDRRGNAADDANQAKPIIPPGIEVILEFVTKFLNHKETRNYTASIRDGRILAASVAHWYIAEGVGNILDDGV